MTTQPYAAQTDSPDRFRFWTAEQLRELPSPRWIVEGYLPEGGLIMLLGKSGTGKSFVALDWALSVATGIAWHAHAVNQGMVIYVAGEGQRGLGGRVAAWEHDRQIRAGAAIQFVLEPVQLHSEDDVDLFLQTVSGNNLEPKVIVIDTLACSFVGGDENAAVDMGKLIAGSKKFIEKTHSTVVLVHHEGKTRAKGARGHSSLWAAIDVGVQVEKSGDYVSVKLAKVKDGVGGDDLTLALKTVEVPGEDDRVIQSAVLVLHGGPQPRAKRLTKDEGALLSFACSQPERIQTSDWRQAMQSMASVTEDRFYKARKSLVDRGLIEEVERGVSRVTALGVTAATAEVLPAAVTHCTTH